MPNTIPADLDRDDWVASVFVSNHGVDMDLEAHIACKLPDGVHKLYARPALPRASGVPEAEAVANRCTMGVGCDEVGICYADAQGQPERCAVAPPVAAPSGEALAEDVAGDFEITYRDYVWAKSCADFIRRSILHYCRRDAAPYLSIASEPKDAGNATDAAYRERNQVVAALARCFPSGVKKTAIDGWDTAWHNCVYIDLPTGQASWHYHDDDTALFEGLPPYQGEWDGHSTPEKYERLARLKDAGSGERQQLDTDQQVGVALMAFGNINIDAARARVAFLNAKGFCITRTAPSGAKS